MCQQIDGERLLCHKKGRELKWFTRQTTDYTEKYGPVMNDVILQNVSAEEAILDGEMVGYDNLHERIVPFGFNQTVARVGP